MASPLTCGTCGSTLYSTAQSKQRNDKEEEKHRGRIKFSICLNPNEASQGANVSFVPLEVKAENS